LRYARPYTVVTRVFSAHCNDIVIVQTKADRNQR